MMNKLICSAAFIGFLSGLAQANQITPGGIDVIEYDKTIHFDDEKNKPQYSELDLGLGFGYGSVPDYPAANESSKKTLVLPVVIYRGNVLKSDQEEGTRAELFSSRDVDINLSFGARFSNDSDDNKARTGMPNLNYTLETGPSLNYRLMRMPEIGTLTLQLPLRLTFETDFKKYDYLGMVFEPELKLQKNNFLIKNLRSSTSVSMEFMSQKVADYFYEVESRYAVVDRAEYKAKSGLSTVSFGQNFIYQHNKWNFITGINYAYFGYSQNKQSPLFKSEHNTSVFMAVAWFFYQKKFDSN